MTIPTLDPEQPEQPEEQVPPSSQESTPSPPEPQSQDWLQTQPVPLEATTRHRFWRKHRRIWAAAAAVLVAGACVAGGVAIGSGHDHARDRGLAASGDTFPGGAGGPGLDNNAGQGGRQGNDDRNGRSGQPNGAQPGIPNGAGRGQLNGEQRIQGTLTAVSGSSVTVKSASGTATYTVTSSTQIIRNGAQATLAQLQVNDPVFVDVYSSTNGGALEVERIFAGTMPAGAPPAGSGTGS